MQCNKQIAVNDMLVPCGSCAICKFNLVQDWAIRIFHEAQYNCTALFVTLTYAVAPNELQKSDLQKWLKRLRKKKDVRYFAVGEYGKKFCRPHYHVILFTNEIITHSDIYDTWKHGFVHVGHLTQQSTMYVLKYMLKASPESDRSPPFRLMSRRPGIGAKKVEQLVGIEKNFLYLNGFKKRMPRYYKDKLFTKQQKQAMRIKTEEQQKQLKVKELARLTRLTKQNPFDEYREREQRAHQIYEYRARNIKTKM